MRRLKRRGPNAVAPPVPIALRAVVCVSLGLALGIAGAPGTGPVDAQAAPAQAAPARARLGFADGTGHVETLDLAALRRRCPEQVVEVDDPYHRRRMRYAALDLRCVLDAGFANAGGGDFLRDRGLLLHALDGYTRPVAGRELLAPGGHLAFGEPARLAAADGGARFTPIDRRRVDPAPFYLVWTGEGQSDPHSTPWPYQLSRIEVAPFERAFPRTVPRGLAEGDPGWQGYSLFQRACASCHAINGEGGRVGPDLNVPRSIVEYRPEAQIRAYVRDPSAFRYTSMPAHPDLDDSDLDALIAYFRAMSERKQDPGAEEGA